MKLITTCIVTEKKKPFENSAQMLQQYLTIKSLEDNKKYSVTIFGDEQINKLNEIEKVENEIIMELELTSSYHSKYPVLYLNVLKIVTTSK